MKLEAMTVITLVIAVLGSGFGTAIGVVAAGSGPWSTFHITFTAGLFLVGVAGIFLILWYAYLKGNKEQE